MYLLLWYNRMVGNLIRYINTEPSISFTQNIFNTRTVTMKRNRDSSLVNYLCTQTFIPHRFVLSKLRRFLRQRWEKTDEDSPVTLTCSPWISARWAFSASSSRLLSASSFWMNSTSLKVQEANGRAPGSCVLTSENRNSFFFFLFTQIMLSEQLAIQQGIIQSHTTNEVRLSKGRMASFSPSACFAVVLTTLRLCCAVLSSTTDEHGGFCFINLLPFGLQGPSQLESIRVALSSRGSDGTDWKNYGTEA